MAPHSTNPTASQNVLNMTYSSNRLAGEHVRRAFAENRNSAADESAG
jgi:hypothetical protein